MSSRDPLWFCHECHAEMRPLMTPGPVCASCHGSFVEKLENPADDPREFQNRAPDTLDLPNNFSTAFEDFLRSGSWPSSSDTVANSSARRSPQTQDPSSANSGFRFEFHGGSGSGDASSRTVTFGGPNTLRRSPPRIPRPVPTMFDFLRRDVNSANNLYATADITGPLMAQYLLALFGRESHAHGDPFAELLGVPPSAQWGDYVFNQEGPSFIVSLPTPSHMPKALDQILTQLAENSTAGRPVPATEEIINNLQRDVLTEDSPLLERDCAICKESFKSDPDDPDESIVISLPCKHPFHQGCILPWLKSSGTCPVCRFALIPQPQHHPSGGPSGGGSSSDRPNPSSGSRSGNSDRGRSGSSSLFQALFRGGAGSSGNNDSYSARSRNSSGSGDHNTSPEVIPHSTPPFPGRWIEDID